MIELGEVRTNKRRALLAALAIRALPACTGIEKVHPAVSIRDVDGVGVATNVPELPYS